MQQCEGMKNVRNKNFFPFFLEVRGIISIYLSLSFFLFLSFSLFLFLFQQHIITCHQTENLGLPYSRDNQGEILTKKIKGVKRNAHKDITYADFVSVSRYNQPARKILLYHIRKFKFKIFVIRNKKTILSRFSTKRLFSNIYRRKDAFFSFPLHWKSVIL